MLTRVVAALAALSLFAAGASAQIIGGASTYSTTPITQRAPTTLDDASHGYAVGNLWQYNGVVYQAASVTNGAASWIPQTAAQFPVYAAPTARSYGGQGAGAQQHIVDILGSSVKLACGTTALKAGFTGPAITVTTTVSSATTNTDINILADGTLDAATLRSTLSAADVGTSATVTKCYDQSGNGNHLTKNASYPGPLIGARSVNGIPEMSWGYVQGESGLVIPAGYSVSGNNFSVFMLGEMLSATGHNADIFEIGDSSGAGPSFALSGPSGASTTQTGLNLFTKAMGTPSPSLPPVYPASETQILGFVSNAGTATLFSNEQSTSISWNSSQTIAGGNVGRLASAANQFGMMSMFGLVMLNAAPTSDQITRIKRAAYARYNITPQIQDQVFTVGDSRTEGDRTNIRNSWPTQLRDMLNAVRPIKLTNFGFSGQTALKVTTDAAVVLAGLKKSGARNIAIIGPLGTNDMGSGTTAAQSFAYTQSICATLTNAGFTTIAVNELPRTGATNTTITSYRALFNAGPTGCTYSIDAAGSVTELSDPNNTTYYADGLHPTDAGQGLLAAFIAQTVAPLIR